jgi:hypothetical protein
MCELRKGMVEEKPVFDKDSFYVRLKATFVVVRSAFDSQRDVPIHASTYPLIPDAV